MKILKIKYENINSLLGKGEIDFTQDPLKDAGLFAITGKTGSGKSTLLDIICLALYNRIPRYDGKTISKNIVKDEGAMVTRNTDFALAEVTYESAEGIFISKWEISKTRTGNFRDYDMQVSDINGVILSDKKSDVPEINSSKIGLSYEQFTKSALLAQGDFAKFLKAGKNERSELLEQITGTDIYRLIGRKTYEIFKKYENDYKELEKKFNENKEKLLSNEQYFELVEQIKKIDESITNNQKLINSIDVLKNQFIQYNSELKKKKKFDKELESYKNELDDFNINYSQKIEKHKELLPLESDIIKWYSLNESFEKHSAKENLIKNKIEEYSENILQSINEISYFTNVDIDESNALDELSNFTDKYNNQLNLLNGIRKDYIAQTELIKSTGFDEFPLEKFKKQHDINLITEIIDKLNDKDKKLNKYFSENNLSGNEDEITHLFELKENIVAFHNEINNLNNSKEQLNEITNEYDRLIPQKNQLPEKISNLKKELEIKELMRGKLQAEYELKRMVAKYEEDRKNLKQNEPCPLCGSEEHPYVTEYPDTDTAEGKKEIRKCETEIKQINKDIASFAQEEKNITKRLDELTKSKSKLSREIEKIDYDIQKYESKIDSKYKEMALNDSKKIIDSSISKIKEYVINVAQLNIAAKIKLYAAKAIIYQKEIDKSKKDLDDLYSGKNFKKEYDKLKKDFADAEKQLEKSKNDYAVWHENFNDISSQLELISGKLLPELNNLKYDNIGDAYRNILKSSDYNELTENRNSLVSKIDRTKSSIALVNENIARFKPEKEISESYIETEIIRLNKEHKELNSQRDDKKSVETLYLKLKNETEELKEKIKILKPDFRKWDILNKMIGDATGNKFRNYAQQLTLRHLIIYANKRISQLSGRYLLQFPESEQDDLTIIDKDMGNAERVVKTLSGGETFLISLSLALALSDLASKNVKINSLFIDEGFGSLDRETLDTTLNTLELLQSRSNKTIGIISHVEALKERVNTQIEVERNGQGYSRLIIKE
jgi:exonuclease SbcC